MHLTGNFLSDEKLIALLTSISNKIQEIHINSILSDDVKSTLMKSFEICRDRNLNLKLVVPHCVIDSKEIPKEMIQNPNILQIIESMAEKKVGNTFDEDDEDEPDNEDEHDDDYDYYQDYDYDYDSDYNLSE